MSRGTNVIGVFFLALGLVIAVAVSAVMIAARSVSLAGAVALAIGVCAAIIGALFVEPDAAKTALHSLGSEVGPYVPGGRRANDPPDRPTP